MEHPRLSTRWLAPVVAFAAVGGLVFATFLPPLCPLRFIAGVPCPSCGLTRAARLALVGRFHEASAVHPLWGVMLPLVAVFLAAETIGFARTGAWGHASRARGATAIATVAIVLLIAVWVARFFGAFGGPAPVA